MATTDNETNLIEFRLELDNLEDDHQTWEQEGPLDWIVHDAADEVETKDNRSTEEPPIPQAQEHQPREPRGTECDACLEVTIEQDILPLSCGHKYCKDCITVMFESAIISEFSFPPRCCQVITSTMAEGILSAELIQQFENKANEYGARSRTYCSAADCLTFIPPGIVSDDVATCPACQQQTCTICKNGSHEGDCPFDAAHQAVMEMAQENGWKRCYSCHRLLERNTGCNHMTCLCGAEFCYVCGERWKTCGCLAFGNVGVQDGGGGVANFGVLRDQLRRNDLWQLNAGNEPLPELLHANRVLVARANRRRARRAQHEEHLRALRAQQHEERPGALRPVERLQLMRPLVEELTRLPPPHTQIRRGLQDLQRALEWAEPAEPRRRA